MAQDDSAPSTSRFVRAAGRIATIARTRHQHYTVDWVPFIKWKWMRIGTQSAPWCPQCGTIAGGKFDQRGKTNGQTAHEEWHESLEKWFDQADDDTELLKRIALLLKPWLEPEPGNEDDNAADEDPEDSGPAFYEDSSEQDSGEDQGA